jgi:hypothetical protein
LFAALVPALVLWPGVGFGVEDEVEAFKLESGWWAGGVPRMFGSVMAVNWGGFKFFVIDLGNWLFRREGFG